jgi:hypothetical protein
MFFRGANSIEGGYVAFSKTNFVADSNEIAVSYRIGCVEFRHMESSGHRPTPFVGVGAKNNEKFEFFRFFVNFS